VVVGASSTVTFWPVGVANSKLVEDTALVVPTAPLTAGAVRAFEVPLSDPYPARCGTRVADLAWSALELEVAMPTVAPTIPARRASEAIHRLFLLPSHSGVFDVADDPEVEVCTALLLS
jgi:hypothetical protein